MTMTEPPVMSNPHSTPRYRALTQASTDVMAGK